MLRHLKTLWDFSRPHTIIGSILSITALFLLACSINGQIQGITIYLLTLLSALGCNVFIVGLNQLLDIEIDKINKPFLPLAEGRLSVPAARRILLISLIICLCVAGFVSQHLLLIMLAILVIGIIYSVPPFRLKNHHIPASIAISGVRGLIVNYWIGYFFLEMITTPPYDKSLIIGLTVFMVLFSIAIAWFKDLYDVEGDKAHNVKTLAILYNSSTAFKLGNGLILAGYLFNVIYYWQNTAVLAIGHLVLGLAYVFFIFKSSLQTRESTYRFYMFIWVFFFLEYGLYLVYSLLNF